MFRLSAVDAINPAFERMKAMLFRPFRFKTWLKIGFIGWLAGAGTSGGFNYRGGLPGGSEGGTAGHDVEQTIRVFLSEHMILVIMAVALTMALSVAFLYLSCRFRFILLDSVLERDPQIARGWWRYGGPANRYFGFLICYMLACAVLLGLILGLPLWRAYKSGVFTGDNPFPALFGYLIPILLGVLVLVMVAAIITSLVNDFMVPILALDGTTIGGAWSRLKEMITAEPWAFAGYLGMKLVLSIAAGVAVGIAMVVIILVLAIPTAIVVVVFVLLLKNAGPAGMVIGIILAAIGILVAVGLLLVLSILASAPVAVFFTSYSFYFFGGRYPRLGALLWPQTPAPVTPAPLVPPPPPLPGAAPAM
ncbi:MAG TPA: hypothetical protein VKL40_15915 [Candidatus Angelobacter sp.]|nr:hypothetical protein [Candidatus Angelobacter sp.]